jgi:hypothetical protein
LYIYIYVLIDILIDRYIYVWYAVLVGVVVDTRDTRIKKIFFPLCS